MRRAAMSRSNRRSRTFTLPVALAPAAQRLKRGVVRANHGRGHAERHPLLIIFLCANRRIVEGVRLGALKGYAGAQIREPLRRPARPDYFTFS